MAPAHLQHDEVKRTEPLTDRLIFRGEACIAAEEDGVPLRADDERGPQSRVAIAQAAAGKVLRGRGGHGELCVRELMRFPPVELRSEERRVGKEWRERREWQHTEEKRENELRVMRSSRRL